MHIHAGHRSRATPGLGSSRWRRIWPWMSAGSGRRRRIGGSSWSRRRGWTTWSSGGICDRRCARCRVGSGKWSRCGSWMTFRAGHCGGPRNRHRNGQIPRITRLVPVAYDGREGVRPMFQHLDDPVPLPPSTHEQRQATLRRGESLRHRRRAKVFAATAAAAAVLAAFALSPTLRATTEVPLVAASPSPSVAATATVGPGRGSIAISGVVPESVRSRWLAGKRVTGGSSSPATTAAFPGERHALRFVFLNVTNIYLDGCQWRLVDPAARSDRRRPRRRVRERARVRRQRVRYHRRRVQRQADRVQRSRLQRRRLPRGQTSRCSRRRLRCAHTCGADPIQENQIRILDVGATGW